MGRVVLITGVSRYLGGRMAQILTSDPEVDRVIGVDVVPPRAPIGGAEFVRADIRNPIQRRFSASCLRYLDPAIFDSMLAGRWLDGYDVDHVFRSLQCPTLLLQADVPAGGMLTREDAQHVTDLNPLVTRLPFTDTGHTIHSAATQLLLNTIIPFLETVTW